MASTEQLEREAELSRAQLAASLEQLRSITPGRVVDEILGYAKSGSAELLRGLGNQVVEHPLPATLIGAGIAWLIMSNGQSHAPRDTARGTVYDTRTRTTAAEGWFSQAGHAASSAAGAVRDRAGSAVHGLNERAASTVQGVKDTAHSAMDGITDTVDRTTGMVRDTAQSAIDSLSDTASGIGDSISGAYVAVSDSVNRTASTVAEAANRMIPSQDELALAGQRVWDFCKDQPMVVAGLGIALGAALGAAIPETEAENRLMGETADQLKQKAQDLVSDPLKNANRVAQSVGEHIVDEAAKMAKEGVADLVNNWTSGTKDGTAQSDQPQGGQSPMGSDFSSGQRPFH